MPGDHEGDVTRRVLGLAGSLLGLVESWERRRDDEVISDRSRRMLLADLAAVVELLSKDEEVLAFISEVSRLDLQLTFGDGAEQVKWIVRRMFAAYNIDPRRNAPRRGNMPASELRRLGTVTASVPKDFRGLEQ